MMVTTDNRRVCVRPLFGGEFTSDRAEAFLLAAILDELRLQRILMETDRARETGARTTTTAGGGIFG